MRSNICRKQSAAAALAGTVLSLLGACRSSSSTPTVDQTVNDAGVRMATAMPPDASTYVGSKVVPMNAEADWRLRSGQDPAQPQPGVVWFHDFRSDAEVDAFRWTGGVGNDPRGNGTAR